LTRRSWTPAWGPRRQRASVGKISAKCCSFSAVSAPIFAGKYAFCSIFQNLPDYQAEIFEIWQNFADFATFAKMLLNFHEIADFSNRFFAKILRLQRCKRMQIFNNLVELEKCCQTHIFLQNFVLIQPRTSPPKICKNLQKFANFANFANPNPLTDTAQQRTWGSEACTKARRRGIKSQTPACADWPGIIRRRPSRVAEIP
jgi:hypothetical protein